MIGEIYFIGSLGWYHLLIFGIVVPFLAWRTQQKLAEPGRPLPPRVAVFRSTAITLAIFGAFSWLTASGHDLDLFPALPSPLLAVAIAAGFYALAVAVFSPWWRHAVAKRKRTLHFYMPQTTEEKAWWIVVSILAGVSEEITWRGVQTTLLAAWLGSPLVGAAISAALFGIAHAVQGPKSAAAIALFALGFQAMVWLTGSLLPGIVAHAAYDITAGFAYSRLGQQMGFQPEATSELGT